MADTFNGFVINPEAYWRPAYRISPYNTSFVAQNQKIAIAKKIEPEKLQSCFGSHFMWCNNGKQSIYKALECYSLKEEDEVWIITTSGNKYISSCVTNEIEKFCKWSQEKTDKTRLIFVNHEFGFCFPELQSLKVHNLPIIEDRALSFASTDQDNKTGTIGDFVIYSLPKFFPVNMGGVLQCNNPLLYKETNKNEQLDSYLASLVTFYLNEKAAIREQRLSNYLYLDDKLGSFGFQPQFTLSEKEIPGVFMFRAAGIDLPRLKIFMQQNGVESSIFYGEDSYFIPVHQGLNSGDLDFFCSLILYFLEKYGNQQFTTWQ